MLVSLIAVTWPAKRYSERTKGGGLLKGGTLLRCFPERCQFTCFRLVHLSSLSSFTKLICMYIYIYI